jgi:hypothetical protein
MTNLSDDLPRPPGRARRSSFARQPERTTPLPPAIKWRARKPNAGEDVNKYAIPPEVIPEGMEWEYKRYSTLDKVDREHQVMLTRDGAWDPVTNAMWPSRLGEFGQPDEPIVIGGQMLMQRPAIYSEEARREDHARAVGSVRDHMRSLALPDQSGNKRPKPSVKQDFGTVQLVPADDEPE